MTDLAHLNNLFAASEDPWHTRGGWYAERKQAILLASLPDARYARAFEPGCQDGELTAALAARTDDLLAVDAHWDSVAEASERTRHLSNVHIEHGSLPTDWPPHRQFDLIVLNEIGLSFDPANWACLAGAVKDSLLPEGTVVACHAKHGPAAAPQPDSERLAAETLHGLLNSVLALPRQTKVADYDFILDVWTNRSSSVAEREGLA